LVVLQQVLEDPLLNGDVGQDGEDSKRDLIVALEEAGVYCLSAIGDGPVRLYGRARLVRLTIELETNPLTRWSEKPFDALILMSDGLGFLAHDLAASFKPRLVVKRGLLSP